MPSEYRRDIDRRGIDSDNDLSDGKSGMLDDNVDEWKEEGLGSYLLSTKIQPAEEHILHQIPRERMRPRC